MSKTTSDSYILRGDPEGILDSGSLESICLAEVCALRVLF